MDLDKVYNIYVGVDYESEDSRLDVSARKQFSSDAIEIANIFSFPESNHSCYTSYVTTAEVKKIIADLENPKYTGCDILIYLSGHGSIDNVDGSTAVFLTSDSQLDFQYIYDSINKKDKPNNIAIILDCCHSGGVNRQNGRLNSYWITAASEEATTDNQFHEALVSYLSNSNDTITVTGLINYLQINLKLEQPQALVKTTKPFYLKKNSINFFDIKKVQEETLLRKGKSRTAYPIDISFIEIFSKKMYIEPILVHENEQFELSRLIVDLSNGKSSLILGKPGSGKSFSSYLIQKELINSGIKNISFTMNELVDIRHKSNLSNYIRSHSLYNYLFSYENVKDDLTVLIIDGLDEYNDWSKYEDFLEELMKSFCVLAFSRKEEYQYKINNYITPELFDKIYNLKEWEFENEFINYLDILNNNKLIKIGLDSLLSKASNFKDIINNPLYARMCVYVCDTLDEELHIYNRSTLYFSYLHKLASRHNITQSKSILNLWKEIAFNAFLHNRTNYNLIHENEFLELVKDISSSELRNLKSLFIVKNNSLGVCYNFSHYSFFEFIISLAISSNLQLGFITGDTDESFNFLTIEMKASIRHYLIDLLNYDKINDNDEFPKFLFRIYNSIGNVEDNKELIKKNTLIYLISKCNCNTNNVLQSILNSEQNAFLKNSLYWACARNNDTKAFNEYILLLESSDNEYGYLNRGYHLFYYGDLNLKDVPYLDNHAENSWEKTREFMFSERILKQKNSTTLIKLLDIYTFIDLSIFHRTRISETEYLSLQTALHGLSSYLDNPIAEKFYNALGKIEVDE